MKIGFLDDNKLDYTPDTPFHAPLGGAESTAAYLTAALAARGHEITLINQASAPGDYRGVTVTGRNGSRRQVFNSFDAVVVLTRPMGKLLRSGGVTVPLIYWQHKAAGTSEMAPLSDAAEREAWTSTVFVSDQQRRSFVRGFGLDGHVLRNAASPAVLQSAFVDETFVDRGEDPSLIYASAPGHGLDMLLACFAVVRENLPAARLKICSDYAMYQQADNDPFGAVYALARALPGVDFIGSVSQTQLGEALSRADVLAYPTSFMETSCIVAIEAAAAGCLYAGNDYGPLKETLSGYGHFAPRINSWAQTASSVAKTVIEAVAEARADPEAYRRRRREQSEFFRTTHTWEKRAEEWETFLGRLLGRS